MNNSRPVSTRREQAPGYFRFTVGKKQVTAFSDGFFDSSDMLTNISRQELDAMKVGDARSSEYERVSINVFMVEEDGKKYLIDAGLGSLHDENGGHLHRNMKLAGHAPAEVDAVLLTHMHLDHIGGAFDPNGGALFPNADLFVAKQEIDYWTNAEEEARAPEGLIRYSFQMARRALSAYEGRVRHVELDAEVAPGIRPIPLFGHTPGHVGYSIASEGEKFLIWGDLINSLVQVQRPDVTFFSDVAAREATSTREETFRMVAKERALVCGMHLPFPGVGFLELARGSYRFVPVMWQERL